MVTRNRRYQQSQKGYSRLSSKAVERRIVDEELYGSDVSERMAFSDDRGVASLLFGRGVDRNGFADPHRRGVGAALPARPDTAAVGAMESAPPRAPARERAPARRATPAAEHAGVFTRMWRAIRRLFG